MEMKAVEPPRFVSFVGVVGLQVHGKGAGRLQESSEAQVRT